MTPRAPKPRGNVKLSALREAKSSGVRATRAPRILRTTPDQPAARAAVSSTVRKRGLAPSSARRYCHGSCFARCAHSSRKLSTKNAV